MLPFGKQRTAFFRKRVGNERQRAAGQSHEIGAEQPELVETRGIRVVDGGAVVDLADTRPVQGRGTSAKQRSFGDAVAKSSVKPALAYFPICHGTKSVSSSRKSSRS